MGSLIEINDTLKLKRGEGFPNNIELNKKYNFSIKEKRLFHLKPIRVFLVEEIEKKWNYVGHIFILELKIDAEKDETSGIFEVVQFYTKEYIELVNKFEPPKNQGFIEKGNDNNENK